MTSVLHGAQQHYMRIVSYQRPHYLLQNLNMEIGNKELPTFIADTFMHPVVQLFKGLFLISLLRWSNLVQIGLCDFLQLVVILQLNGQQFAVVIAHMPEEVSDFVGR
jgi:hypothetical protein